MNERIRELAEQSDAYADAMDIGGKNYIGLRDKYFAELIVQECCQAFWTDECHTSDLAYLDYKEKTTKLKRHFGMEE